MKRFLMGSVVLPLAMLGTALTRAADPPGGDVDQVFVIKASEGGMAEVEAGKLASKKANNASVRKFAEHMVEDHTKANKELHTLATNAKLKVAAAVDERHKAMAAKLAQLSGEAFDREYMAGQVKDHEETIALFEKEASQGKVAEIRGFAEKTLPTLREHLKMAQRVQSNLQGGRETTGTKQDRP